MVLHWNKLIYPSPKDTLCLIWLKLTQWFWRRRFFKIVNVFSLFRNYLPLDKGGVLHLKNLTALRSRMICAKFGWNWPSDSREEDFFLFFNVFSQFRNYPPFGKRRSPSFEQTWIPYTKGCFVLSLVEIGPVVLEKKILKIRQCIFRFSYLSPLRKRRGPSFKKLESLSP